MAALSINITTETGEIKSGPSYTLDDSPSAPAPNYPVTRSYLLKVTKLDIPRKAKVSPEILNEDLTVDIPRLIDEVTWDIVEDRNRVQWGRPTHMFDMDLREGVDNDNLTEATALCIWMADPDASFMTDRFLAFRAADEESQHYFHEPRVHASASGVPGKFLTVKFQPGIPYGRYNIGAIFQGNDHWVDPHVKNDG